MSQSICLFCPETNHFVRVGEESGSWFRGNNELLVAVFCRAHLGKLLTSMIGEPSYDDEWPEEWLIEDVNKLYKVVTGDLVPDNIAEKLKLLK
jgi:hypothetical protein